MLRSRQLLFDLITTADKLPALQKGGIEPDDRREHKVEFVHLPDHAVPDRRYILEPCVLHYLLSGDGGNAPPYIFKGYYDLCVLSFRSKFLRAVKYIPRIILYFGPACVCYDPGSVESISLAPTNQPRMLKICSRNDEYLLVLVFADLISPLYRDFPTAKASGPLLIFRKWRQLLKVLCQDRPFRPVQRGILDPGLIQVFHKAHVFFAHPVSTITISGSRAAICSAEGVNESLGMFLRTHLPSAEKLTPTSWRTALIATRFSVWASLKDTILTAGRGSSTLL